MRNTGVYDAAPLMELKCNHLVVSISGSSFASSALPAALLHASDEQQVG